MCMPGDFTTSGGCTHCYVDGETLKCMCHDSKGKPSKVSLNLNECIGNMEGEFAWAELTDPRPPLLRQARLSD